MLASSGLLASCGPHIDVNKPLVGAAKATATYIEAKKAYVAALETAIVGPNAASSRYRLVSVVGPQWQVGAVIDPQNPLNNLTEKCVVNAEALPKPTPWSSYPGMTESKTITLGAGLPSSVVSLLGKDSTVAANLISGKTGQFNLQELSSVIVADDAFSGSFSPDCKAVLALKGGLVIRGIVSGKEIFRSGGSINAGANLKLAETDLLKLQYDDKGDFNLEDKSPTPKMFLMTQFNPENKGAGDVQTAPTAATIARVEALDRNKPR